MTLRRKGMKNKDLLFNYSYDLSNGYDIEEKERVLIKG